MKSVQKWNQRAAPLPMLELIFCSVILSLSVKRGVAESIKLLNQRICNTSTNRIFPTEFYVKQIWSFILSSNMLSN